MSNNHQEQAATDAFTQFWGDVLNRMTTAAGPMSGSMPSPGPEAMKQMQRVFLDAMAKYCDDFMRSEPFLQMMKQTMDRSLAFKQQLDHFLGAAQKGMQAPARADIDDLAGTLLKIEERVLDRLDSLETKVGAMEGGGRKAGAEVQRHKGTKAGRAKGESRTGKKSSGRRGEAKKR